jgi:uncharacterized protein (DUF3084 family)
MDISESDIEWTTGTDKPYGKVVFEQWQEELGEAPTEKDLRRLRNQTSSLESRLKKLNEELEQVHNDAYSGEASAMNMMELIELKEDALERLNELYNHYTEDSKEEITRQQIFSKAQEFKTNGMSVADMFDAISDWLLEELGFTKQEVKKRFNFSLEDAYSFNRLVNKNVSFHN